MNGGFWPLFHAAPTNPTNAFRRAVTMDRLASPPHGFIDRLFGIGAGGWGDWLLYQGTLVAVIAVALVTMLVSSPVNRRALSLLVVPFALGVVIYLCSLISPPPPAPVGNTLAAVPLLLILLAAMAVSLGQGRRAGPDLPGRPAAPGDT
jgi:hypothetical protein